MRVLAIFLRIIGGCLMVAIGILFHFLCYSSLDLLEDPAKQIPVIIVLFIYVSGGLLAYWAGLKIIIREIKKLIKLIKRDERGFTYNMKKIGIMFVVVGFFIPLIFYPFAELTKDVKEKADLLLAVCGVKYSPRFSELKVGSWGYPYIIAVGLISIFVGISIVVLTGKKKSEKTASNNTANQSLNKSKEELSAGNVEKELVVDEITEKVELDASSSTDVVDEITDEAEVDSSASDEVNDEIKEKIELEASNSFQTFIVIMFAVDDLDELINKIGADYTQELLKIIFGHIYKFFLSYGGFASRDTTNEMSVIIQNCDLEKAENLCKSFKSYFFKKIIPDLNTKIKIEKSDGKLEVQILAGIAQGNPMIEMESIKEFARYKMTPIVRIQTPKS